MVRRRMESLSDEDERQKGTLRIYWTRRIDGRTLRRTHRGWDRTWPPAFDRPLSSLLPLSEHGEHQAR